jgi:hypothetical protein
MRGSRCSGTICASSSASGVLSSSERGRALRQRATSQPIDSIVSHCAPLRITPSESARYTCSTRKFSQTCAMPSTAVSNWSALQASAAALMAPADVPQMTPKGQRRGDAAVSRRSRAMARSTPTW